MPRRLMVFIRDRLSALINKGELIDRYYNPGNLFDEVHIVLPNDDQPDLQAAQKAVGNAQLFVHNLPVPSFKATLGWQKPLMADWLRAGIALGRKIQPQLIKAHNNFIESYPAKAIHDDLGTPYIVSLHGVWDRDGLITWQEKFRRSFRVRYEREILQGAEAVIAVYSPILRYAKEYGAKNVFLVYNVVAGANIQPKADYRLNTPPRLITINRQLAEKNPENILRAVARLDGERSCEYWLVGDGPLHAHLEEIAREEGIGDRVRFFKSLPNETICNQLKDFDIMVTHCDYWGISKTTIEAALAGLPVVINHHPSGPLEEYQGGWLHLCENTPRGYLQALQELLEDETKRKALGTQAASHARETFDPQVMEDKLVEIYQGCLKE